MALKTVGLRVLRWGLWLLVLWILVRGIVSFLPPVQAATDDPVSLSGRLEEPDGLRAFPALFAREYLTWQSDDPDDRAQRLRPYLARNLDRQAGWMPSVEHSTQRSEGTWVYGVKSTGENRWLVTVAARVSRSVVSREATAAAAQTPSATTGMQALPGSTIYLGVPVALTPGAGWVVYDYPSLLAEPVRGDASSAPPPGQEVTDGDDQIRAALVGFFGAYFGGDITYYLAPGASVRSLPSGWSFIELSRLQVYLSAVGHTAVTEVVARDPATGSRYTYRYTVDLTQRDGRWYVHDIKQKGD